MLNASLWAGYENLKFLVRKRRIEKMSKQECECKKMQPPPQSLSTLERNVQL